MTGNRQQITYAQVKSELNSYRNQVMEYRACKELYDDLLPSPVHYMTHEPQGYQEFTALERTFFKREPVLDSMKRSLSAMQRKIKWVEMIVSLAGEDNQKTTLAIRYLYGKTIEQTAEIMQCDRTTVTNRTKRGIKEIVKKLNS